MQFSLIIALLIAVVAVLFALQNATPVTVTFLAWRFESSLALVLLIAMVVGALFSAFASLPALIGTRWKLSSQNRRVGKLESMLAEIQQKIEAKPADSKPAAEEQKPAGEKS